MVTYADLISAIVKKQISVIGSERAIGVAKDTKGLSVDASGNVVSGASKTTLSGLVDGYTKIAGSVAIMIMKGAIAPLVKGESIDLPPSLK